MLAVRQHASRVRRGVAHIVIIDQVRRPYVACQLDPQGSGGDGAIGAVSE
jgi:hypothetical protein